MGKSTDPAEQYRKSACMVLSQLAKCVPLSKLLVDTIAAAIASGFALALSRGRQDDVCKDLIMLAAILAQFQQVRSSHSTLMRCFIDWIASDTLSGDVVC